MFIHIPKIALLLWHITSLNFERTGGLERIILTEVELLSSAGIRATIATKSINKASSKYTIQKITPPKLLGSYASLGYYGLFVLRNAFAPVYHAHNSPFVAALCPSKTLVHFNNEVRFPGYEKLRIRYRKAHYACCSEYIRSWLLNTYPDLDEGRVHILYNGADIQRFYPSDRKTPNNGPVRLLFAGQWNEKKGIFLLLEAMARLQERAAEFELLVVGSAGLWQSQADSIIAAETEAKILTYAPMLKNVRFIGPVSYNDMPDIYRSVDVMIVPSIWNEPSALTLSEAMASGLPVIAFPVGGNAEMVSDGETGYLVKQKTPESLAATIASLLDHPEKIPILGNAGRVRAEKYFSWEVHLQNLWKLYGLVNPKLEKYCLNHKQVIEITQPSNWSR